MRSLRQLASIVVAVAALALGCGSENDDESRAGLSIHERDAANEASARVEAFMAAPRWSSFVELLETRHDVARNLLGPHRLRYTAQLGTGPVGVEASAPLPDVAVGEPIYERFDVTDELELRWGSAPGEPPRLSLEQHNEHEHGRALIVIGEQTWTQVDGLTWLAGPLESDLWQLWADDAQHAVLDLVQLAGPHADLDGVEPIEVDGRPAVRVSLRASETHHPERTLEAPTPWRHGATVEIATASIVLDRVTGLWLAAQMELRWRFEDVAGRDLAGLARFDGRVEILAEPPPIAPPGTSEPIPERERPQLLRDRMLDGLAGP
jgi:hypothetical protein